MGPHAECMVGKGRVHDMEKRSANPGVVDVDVETALDSFVDVAVPRSAAKLLLDGGRHAKLINTHVESCRRPLVCSFSSRSFLTDVRSKRRPVHTPTTRLACGGWKGESARMSLSKSRSTLAVPLRGKDSKLAATCCDRARATEGEERKPPERKTEMAAA